MRLSILLLVAAGCYDRVTPVTSVAADDHRSQLTGTITDMDFGCWSDANCRIEVGDTWVTIEGGKRMAQETMGRVIGVELSGASADELKARWIGHPVEVLAAKVPIMDATGTVTGYDPKQLTLSGSADYYIRAR